jgi:two-component system, cell cycle response regulator DivK
MTELHALIIDDNANSMQVLGELLTVEGIQTDLLLNPVQLDMILTSLPKIDVVFLDLEMPEMNGYAVFERLRVHPDFQDTPIVAYSVHTNELSTARQMGFHSFLGKPLDADRFSDQLAQILRGERVWSAA